jgi:hypothetical protein
MKILLSIGIAAALCCQAAEAAKPDFIRLQVPPGKSAADIKPRPQARADEPIVLELRAHRHADGSVWMQCDEHLATPRRQSAETTQ